MSRTELHTKLLTYLGRHNVATLATQGPNGPWASAVFYVNDGLTLYFLSGPTARHSRNLEGDPRVAATVQEDYSEWRQIKGVQLEGRVSRLDAVESLRAAACYARKFPFTDAHQGQGAIVAAMKKIAWYRLEPACLYFIDNSIGLGHRERFDVEEGVGRGCQ
jgi:uncharacterized protein YhbP (UPF0306 family)